MVFNERELEIIVKDVVRVGIYVKLYVSEGQPHHKAVGMVQVGHRRSHTPMLEDGIIQGASGELRYSVLVDIEQLVKLLGSEIKKAGVHVGLPSRRGWTDIRDNYPTSRNKLAALK